MRSTQLSLLAAQPVPPSVSVGGVLRPWVPVVLGPTGRRALT